MSELALLGGEPVRTEAWPDWPVWDEAEIDAVTRVITSGSWGLRSDEIAAFESEYAALQGARHAITVHSGTTAIRIALQALGLKQGEEVIAPAYTFIGSVSPVMDLNAIPRFVDVDPDTYNIDPAQIEAAITGRTVGIIPVHFAGQSADMDAIMAIAEKHGLWVMEDAAQAWGSTWKSGGVGHIGGAGIFSFQASKNITAGEGGIITTDDDEVAEAARSFTNCGRTSDGLWYGHYRNAGNYRMPAIIAAVLRAQTARYPAALAKREENAAYLSSKLGEIPGIHPLKRPAKATAHSYHLFIWRYDSEVFDGLSRDTFIAAMGKEGIPISPGYSLPLNEQPVFAEKRFDPAHPAQAIDFAGIPLPVAKRACESEACWISQSLLLGTRADMDDIVAAVRKVFDNRTKLIETAEAAT